MQLCSKTLFIGLALVLGGCSGPSSSGSSSDVTSANVTADMAADMAEEAVPTQAGDVAADDVMGGASAPAASQTLPAEEDSQALPLSPITSPELEGRQLLVEWSADFEVKNATASARAAEDLARKYGGYVARTDIYTLDLGSDEFAEGGQLIGLHRYMRQAELHLRIPRDRLVAFTDELQREVVFLGESHLSATDITLDMLRRSWAEELARDKAKVLAAQRVEASSADADQQEANLRAIEREFAARKQQNADALAQLELQQKLELSAVSLTLTQPELTRRTTRPDPAALARAYAPSFGERLGYSAGRGWQALQSFALLLVMLWPVLLLLGVLGSAWYMWQKRPRRSAGVIEARASKDKSTRGKNGQNNAQEDGREE